MSLLTKIDSGPKAGVDEWNHRCKTNSATFKSHVIDRMQGVIFSEGYRWRPRVQPCSGCQRLGIWNHARLSTYPWNYGVHSVRGNHAWLPSDRVSHALKVVPSWGSPPSADMVTSGGAQFLYLGWRVVCGAHALPTLSL